MQKVAFAFACDSLRFVFLADLVNPTQKFMGMCTWAVLHVVFLADLANANANAIFVTPGEPFCAQKHPRSLLESKSSSSDASGKCRLFGLFGSFLMRFLKNQNGSF